MSTARKTLTRRGFLTAAGLGAATLAFARDAKPRRPNFILFLTGSMYLVCL